MVFQMRSVSSAASGTAVSARQVLLGASFDLHLLFLELLALLGPIQDKRSVLCCDFSQLCVLSTSQQHISFLCVGIGHMKKLE